MNISGVVPDLWEVEDLRNGHAQPTAQPNAWAAAPGDAAPAATVRWATPHPIGRVELGFDADLDHALETVLWPHPENAMPFCVRHYRVRDGDTVVAERTANHQTCDTIGDVPAAAFEVRCYPPTTGGRP
ncbi:hypothetical protein E1262_23880 [Jiangella aurantiaca]|uniref:Uncharacterized protein n=1 Tax=Jiangella aurantiaca TaxID=2530373 RepID=A0A4V2YRN4_9ACTN|nr:hypothetical protein [Jiangella aurantiaca]TDD65857.1 hypothetical protein E1262_23880 [Jiangella aurantiaca]